MSIIIGLRTIIYHVNDLNKAKKWYSEAFGIKPYFDESYYAGFNIGGFELGLDPDMSGVTIGTNSVAYWGVKNIKETLKHLIEFGAKINSDVQDVGGDILVATIKDPFGNILGMIENPHFKYQEK